MVRIKTVAGEILTRDKNNIRHVDATLAGNRAGVQRKPAFDVQCL
jgi:hypothetical protein